MSKIKDYQAKEELQNEDVFISVSNFTNINGTLYWSSTEIDDVNTWSQNFDFGYQLSYTKFYTYNVRAVRAF